MQKENSTRRETVRYAVALACCWWVSFVVGCSLIPRVHAPKVSAGFRHGSPDLSQRGEVATPASARTDTTVSTLPIPAGSTVTIASNANTGAVRSINAENGATRAASDPASLQVTLSAASELRTETRTESVEGAKSFTPPAPPTPSEIARGQGVKLFYAAGALCGLAAVAAFILKFPRMGISLGVAAVALPVVGGVLSSPVVAYIIAAAGIAAGFAYWHAHHVHSAVLDNVKAELSSAKSKLDLPAAV